MKGTRRVFGLLVAGLVGAGCATPGGGPVRYPAHGFTSFRPYFVGFGNLSSHRVVTRGGPTFGDPGDVGSQDLWPTGFGGGVEATADANPFLGMHLGIGYEYYKADEQTGPGGDTLRVDELNLMPIYVGVTGRLPFWVDWSKWSEDPDRKSLPDPPIGPALYAKLSGGAAVLWHRVDVYSSKINESHKGLDYQLSPFVQATGGVEYRIKGFGLWCEAGYRYLYLTDAGYASFDPNDLSGVIGMVGFTIYTW